MNPPLKHSLRLLTISGLAAGLTLWSPSKSFADDVSFTVRRSELTCTFQDGTTSFTTLTDSDLVRMLSYSRSAQYERRIKSYELRIARFEEMLERERGSKRLQERLLARVARYKEELAELKLQYDALIELCNSLGDEPVEPTPSDETDDKDDASEDERDNERDEGEGRDELPPKTNPKLPTPPRSDDDSKGSAGEERDTKSTPPAPKDEETAPKDEESAPKVERLARLARGTSFHGGSFEDLEVLVAGIGSGEKLVGIYKNHTGKIERTFDFVSQGAGHYIARFMRIPANSFVGVSIFREDADPLIDKPVTGVSTIMVLPTNAKRDLRERVNPEEYPFPAFSSPGKESPLLRMFGGTAEHSFQSERRQHLIAGVPEGTKVVAIYRNSKLPEWDKAFTFTNLGFDMYEVNISRLPGGGGFLGVYLFNEGDDPLTSEPILGFARILAKTV